MEGKQKGNRRGMKGGKGERKGCYLVNKLTVVGQLGDGGCSWRSACANR